MGRELLCRHFLRSSGGWSGNGGHRLLDCGFSLLFGAISTKMSQLSTPKAKTLLHQLGPLLVRHCFVYFRDDIDVHGVLVSFLSEVPPWFPLLFLWSVSLDDPLHLVVVVINL